MAYDIGLITADGCLINDGRHIDFTSKDRQLVELYRTLVQPLAKIGEKYNNSGLRYWRIQISNVAFYDFLLKVGLIPRKSLLLQALRVPSMFFADFLRGYFDGDGSVYGNRDRRWRGSYSLYTSFASASPEFLIWLKVKIETTTGARGHLKKSASNLYQLCYGKQASRLLHSYMYYNREVPHLWRKHHRYLEIYNMGQYNPRS